MANEALESLQRTLIQILQRSDDFITRHVKLQIIRIHDKAIFLQLKLKHFLDEETFTEVANAAAEIIHYLFPPENLSSTEAPAVRQLEELAAELESTAGDVVDYISSSSSSSSSSSDEDLTLPVELTITISYRLRRLLGKIKPQADFDEHPSDNNGVVSSSPFESCIKEDVVGFEEDRKHVIDQLISTSSTRRRQCLTIVGMAGIGKSTLAKTVYDSESIVQHFDVRAWATISQDSSEESVLSTLLASIEERAEQVERETDVEGISNGFLGRLLLRVSGMENKKRYLIVMDNVSSTKLWDDILYKLPQNDNGSRILLTTRLMNLAETYWSYIHMMQFMDEQKSWDLFQRQVFGDQTCPLELQCVAKNIVKRCGGLPLLIVTKARLLYKIDRTSPKLWQQIGHNDKELATILSLSYNQLPRHLKKCFLYMAGFPEDYEIHASQLVKLWIAEGFFDCIHEYKSLEEVGEDYLNQLFHESLVLITNRNVAAWIAWSIFIWHNLCMRRNSWWSGIPCGSRYILFSP